MKDGNMSGNFNAVRSLIIKIFIVMAAFISIAEPVWASGNKILVLGDSLTAGYGLGPGESFADQLARALNDAGQSAEVINAGVSGDTTAGGRGRIGWLLAGQEKPDLVIIELGANDGLRAINPESTRANLASIIEQAESSGSRVLLTGMLAPPNLGQEYADAFNRIYPDLAEKYDVAFYPFFLEGVAGVPHLNQQDGIHPTVEGVAIIVENILPTIIKNLPE